MATILTLSSEWSTQNRGRASAPTEQARGGFLYLAGQPDDTASSMLEPSQLRDSRSRLCAYIEEWGHQGPRYIGHPPSCRTANLVDKSVRSP